MHQDAGGPGTVGKDLTAVFFDGKSQADCALFKRDGAIADHAVKAQPGNVRHLEWIQVHRPAVAGGVGVRQVALAVTIHINVVGQQRVQPHDAILAGADDLAV